MGRIVAIAVVVGALGALALASPASADINCDTEGTVLTCHGGEGSGGNGGGGGVGVYIRYDFSSGEFFDAGGSGLGGSGEGGGGGQHCEGIIPPPEALECHGGVSQ
jgi:hypothetical protein